jgi:hypothetical protein
MYLSQLNKYLLCWNYWKYWIPLKDYHYHVESIITPLVSTNYISLCVYWTRRCYSSLTKGYPGYINVVCISDKILSIYHKLDPTTYHETPISYHLPKSQGMYKVGVHDRRLNTSKIGSIIDNLPTDTTNRALMANWNSWIFLKELVKKQEIEQKKKDFKIL